MLCRLFLVIFVLQSIILYSVYSFHLQCQMHFPLHRFCTFFTSTDLPFSFTGEEANKFANKWPEKWVWKHCITQKGTNDSMQSLFCVIPASSIKMSGTTCSTLTACVDKVFFFIALNKWERSIPFVFVFELYAKLLTFICYRLGFHSCC